MKKPRYNVAVVEDHPAMREGLAQVLSVVPHCTVVLQAEHGEAYEAALEPTTPIHLALVDLCMPVRDGYETIAWIRANQPDTRVAAITFDPRPCVVDRAVQAGAHTVLCKTMHCAAIQEAVAQVLATGYHHNTLMEAQLRYRPQPGSPEALRAKVQKDLSPRELQFLLLYIHPTHHSLVEVAKRMKISVHTAEDYRKKIREKTGASTRVDMIHFARRFGLG